MENKSAITRIREFIESGDFPKLTIHEALMNVVLECHKMEAEEQAQKLHPDVPSMVDVAEMADDLLEAKAEIKRLQAQKPANRTGNIDPVCGGDMDVCPYDHDNGTWKQEAPALVDDTVLGVGNLAFDGIENTWYVPTVLRSDGIKKCGQYGELIFRQRHTGGKV